MRIQICYMHIQNDQKQRRHQSFVPMGKFKGKVDLLADSKFSAFSCSSGIMEVPSVAQGAFEMCQELLYVHSKYCRSCSIHVMKTG
jgi:hypothetical protein